jgi:broad specificity phosphatase PhoE
MRPTRILLIRHGEVASDWAGRVYGAFDVPLSERGHQQTRRIVGALRSVDLCAVVSSGLQRTEAMAATLCESRALERHRDPELREVERGSWVGKHPGKMEASEAEAFLRWSHDSKQRAPGGGESLEDLAARVQPRLVHWAHVYAGETLAVVTHAWVIRVTLCQVLGASLDRASRIEVQTGEVILLKLTDSSHRSLEGLASVI